ncbi:FAD-dependent oxidoreductase [Rhizobium sp. L1K21]|uniref:FAD-dependent oxidoreductase n=1 Tax=Rhizobium sp. L1K21 TaxID=2954933 RepID=UPI002092BFAE|nr:FAD-dependent oxidoreductase [Rhizobium sp. L1K21]
MKRAVLFFVLIALVATAYLLYADRMPGLVDLKKNAESLSRWINESPLVAASVYLILYVVAVAFSLPIAALLTLAGGALFGFLPGLIMALLAAAVGALVSFLVARTLLRETVQQNFARQLAPINAGLKRNGAFYLFTLRLIPAFPFFVVNLVMGLTPVRAWTFFWVSLVGMLPGTAVFALAGTQLANIDSLSGILSPGILFTFALIGLLPWIAKLVIALLRRRKVYRGWTKPRRFDRNLVVIGAGSAGLVSTYLATAVKAKVTLVEAGEMGGDCLNYGCVPSKALLKSARLAHQIRHADHYGLVPSEPAFSFRSVMARIHAVIAEIAPHDSVERYEQLGAEVLKGYARIKDPWTVEVSLNGGGVRTLTTRAIVVATGASPFVPPLPGIEETGYLTSDTLWEKLADRDRPPARLVLLGGGPVGCELAQSFARLGSSVTQVEKGPRLISREDEDVSEFVRQTLATDGVRILTGHKATACKVVDGEKYIIVECDGVQEEIAFDELICAVGRVPRLKGFGLEAIGVKTGRTIETNEYLETLFPNILAAGDVAGPYQFTHTASHQAWYASVNALFGDLKRFKADYRVIPWTTFVDPEVARVGLNEQEAREQGLEVEVTRYGLDDLDRAIADGNARGFVKVLTLPGKDRILGVTIVGEHAGDLLAEFVLAMKHGLGLNKILSTIHTYPTMAEANKYAAGAWRRAHVSPRITAFLERYHRFWRGAA